MQQADEDKRGELRRRALKGGKIIFNNHFNVLDCTIRNWSESGCHIRVANNRDVPDLFQLRLTSSEEEFDCKVIWRKTDDIGVQFES